MRTLLLLRHAKALPAEGRQPDRERALAARGHSDARLMGAAIAARWMPQLVLISPAVRTVETLEEIAASFSDPHPVVVRDEALYGGGVEEYVSAVEAHGGKTSRILVVGHNPSIHETALWLAASASGKLRAKFPTCALAVIRFDTSDWSDTRKGSGAVVAFLRPKDLGALDADD